MKRTKQYKIDSLKTIIADKTLDAAFRASASDKLAALESEPVKKKMKTSSIKKENKESSYEKVEFTVPEWSLSYLINGDGSGLDEEEITKLEKFVNKTVNTYGNANFSTVSEESEGFQRSNDIDNLGSNVHTVAILVDKKDKNKPDMKPKKSALELAKEKSKTKKTKKELPSFHLAFKISNRITFEVSYYRLGSNKEKYFTTSASELNRNRNDYDSAGQGQEGLLTRYPNVFKFYKKYDSLHLKDLTESQYNEIVNSLNELKKVYPQYIEKNSDEDIRFSEIVELSREKYTDKTEKSTHPGTSAFELAKEKSKSKKK